MGFRLRQGITFCVIDGTAIFLDEPSNRYFALADAAGRAFVDLTTGDDRAATRDRLARLFAAGLLAATEDDDRPIACPRPDLPEDSIVDLARGRTRPIGAVLAIWRLRHAAAGLAQSLHHPLAGLRRRNAQLVVKPGDEHLRLRRIMDGFDTAQLVLAPLDQCLPHSIAVAHRALDMRVRPTLVMGVRLQPFAAHCWVQSGNWLINDRFDQVRNFTPILVL